MLQRRGDNLFDVQRSFLPRVLIALWGLWFTALVTEVPGLDACPVHAHHAHGGHAMAMAMGGAHQHVHAARDGVASRSLSAENTAQCTCMGCCCAGTAPLPTVVGLRRAIAIVVGTPAPRAEQLVPRAAWPHALPFATAPPATV